MEQHAASGSAPLHSDVIVIGAGINGSAIARDAAMRGMSVLLIERNDISNGTSAWSSRMIHGGLKYLENYEFDLVRESLREREWLLRSAPHLVKPLPFMMPFLRSNKRPPWLLRMGMVAYDVLSIDKSLEHHHILSRQRALELASGIEPGQLRGAALYYDAQAENAERLSVENVLSAREHGALVLTRTAVTALTIEGNRVTGVKWRDELTEAEGTATAQIVVNATGPWADELLKDIPGHAQPLVGGTKGTHFVVDAFAGAPKVAMYYEARLDKRPLMVLPWRGRYLIGSTDIRYSGDPDLARADDGEYDYILSETNALMPGAQLSREDIVFQYTGVRPLPYEPNDDVAKITRHHVIHDHAPTVEGLITIVGGKLTTFRSLGEDAVNRVTRKLKVRRPKSTTRVEALPGARTADYAAFAKWFRGQLDDPRMADRLLSIYGTRASGIAELSRATSGLGRTVDDGNLVLAAEPVFAMNTESARTLTDVIMRRTMLGLDPELSIATVENIATVLAEHLGWTAARSNKEIDAYQSYAARFRPDTAERPAPDETGPRVAVPA